MNDESTNTTAGSGMMDSSSTNDHSTNVTNKLSILYQAIEENNYIAIESVLNDGADVNAVLITIGPQAGYTALHMACKYHDLRLVILFAENHSANVNAVADDGTQPIHLACFVEDNIIIRILLDAGANVNVEFEQDIHEKYVKDKVWSDDFGGIITLLTFAVLNNDVELIELLLEYNADVTIKSLQNKTLLMYALEKDNDKTAMMIASNMVNHGDILNARDNNGMHAIHYILHKNKYGEFRYDEKQLKLALEEREYLKSLILRAGPDAYGPINGDPDSTLVNVAAYRSCFSILNIVLPLSSSIDQSKALRNATLPVKDPQKYLRTYEALRDFDSEKELERQRKLSIECIVRDLYFRRTFGLLVPEEEIKLLNESIAKDTDVRKIITMYQKDFIEGSLKDKVIHYGDKSMTFYELAMKVFDDEALNLLVKDQELINAVEAAEMEEDTNENNLQYFFTMLMSRIEQTPK